MFVSSGKITTDRSSLCRVMAPILSSYSYFGHRLWIDAFMSLVNTSCKRYGNGLKLKRYFRSISLDKVASSHLSIMNLEDQAISELVVWCLP